MRVSLAVLTRVIRTKGGTEEQERAGKANSLRQKEARLHAVPRQGVERPPAGKEDTAASGSMQMRRQGESALLFIQCGSFFRLQKHFVLIPRGHL